VQAGLLLGANFLPLYEGANWQTCRSRPRCLTILKLCLFALLCWDVNHSGSGSAGGGAGLHALQSHKLRSGDAIIGAGGHPAGACGAAPAAGATPHHVAGSLTCVEAGTWSVHASLAHGLAATSGGDASLPVGRPPPTRHHPSLSVLFSEVGQVRPSCCACCRHRCRHCCCLLPPAGGAETACYRICSSECWFLPTQWGSMSMMRAAPPACLPACLPCPTNLPPCSPPGLQSKLFALMHAGLAFRYSRWQHTAVLQTVLVAVAASQTSWQDVCTRAELAAPGGRATTQLAARLLTSTHWLGLYPTPEAAASADAGSPDAAAGGCWPLMGPPDHLDACRLLLAWVQASGAAPPASACPQPRAAREPATPATAWSLLSALLSLPD
jgi:hypothetical protein